MTGTVQPERPRSDRRKKSRQLHLKLTNKERKIYARWYEFLRDVLHKEMRRKRVKFFVIKFKNRANVLPKDAVREELRHVFSEDWKCSLDFDDINKTVHMKDDR
ncbi:MAG: hypothetical protein Q7S81_03335 [bacterium]|nr:hypothetical protein [bacterium]